jgi:hypothetical protein
MSNAILRFPLLQEGKVDLTSLEFDDLLSTLRSRRYPETLTTLAREEVALAEDKVPGHRAQ